LFQTDTFYTYHLGGKEYQFILCKLYLIKHNYFRFAIHFVNRFFFCVKVLYVSRSSSYSSLLLIFRLVLPADGVQSAKLCQTANAIKARRLYILTECLY